jgi:hypothetical protein
METQTNLPEDKTRSIAGVLVVISVGMLALDIRSVALGLPLPVLSRFEEYGSPVIVLLLFTVAVRASLFLKLAMIEMAALFIANYVPRFFGWSAPSWRIPVIVVWTALAITCAWELRSSAHSPTDHVPTPDH